jgi:hypothetical protein
MRESTIWLAFVLSAIGGKTRLYAEELPPDVVAVIGAAIRAHEAESTRMRAGTGVARVSRTRNDGDPEKDQVRFWYAGGARRTDVYGEKIQEGSAPRASLADNGEFFYGYNRLSDTARVGHSAWGESYMGELGLDFHPAVFGWCGPISVLRVLKNLRDAPYEGGRKAEVVTRNEGLLELRVSWNTPKQYDQQRVDAVTTLKLVIDPEHSYRVVEYVEENQNVNGLDSTEMRSMKIDWDDSTSGEGYPKSITSSYRDLLSLRAWTNRPEDAPPDYPREHTGSIQVVIDQFQPNVEVDEAFFTLEGMGVADGILVYDTVAGLTYRYNDAVVTEDSLETLYEASQAGDDSGSLRENVEERSGGEPQGQRESSALDTKESNAEERKGADRASQVIRHMSWCMIGGVVIVGVVWAARRIRRTR